MFIDDKKRGIDFMKNIFEISVEINLLINVISIKNLCNHITRDSEEYFGKRF